MKQKILSLLGAIACIFMFGACDPSSFLDDLLGEMTLTVTTADSTGIDGYAEGDTISFSSSVVDCADLASLADPTATDSVVNNIFLGANIELTSATIITNPFCGFQLKDTNTGTYNIEMPLEVEDFANLQPETILTRASTSNVFLMAISDTAWIIGYDGQITLSEYPEYGFLAEGTVNSLLAYYVTKSKIDYLTDLINRAGAADPDAIIELQNFNLNTFFDPIILNGTFSSRRANIASLIQSLVDKFNQEF